MTTTEEPTIPGVGVASISTPDVIESRLGPLRFNDKSWRPSEIEPT